MLTGEAIPQVREGTLLHEAIEELDRKRLGAVIVVDNFNHLRGIFTDGDLRRLIRKT